MTRTLSTILFETTCRIRVEFDGSIGPLHNPVTWYRINYTGMQITQWDFQNKGTRTSPAQLSFVLKVPLRNLRPSVIYSVPCHRIVQRAYSAIQSILLTGLISAAAASGTILLLTPCWGLKGTKTADINATCFNTIDSYSPHYSLSLPPVSGQ